MAFTSSYTEGLIQQSEYYYGIPSLEITGSFTADNFSGSVLDINSSASFTGLPTSEPIITGSLWISGSSAAHPNSGYLMVFNP